MSRKQSEKPGVKALAMLAELETEIEEVRDDYDLVIGEAAYVRTPNGRELSWQYLDQLRQRVVINEAKTIAKSVIDEMMSNVTIAEE